MSPALSISELTVRCGAQQLVSGLDLAIAESSLTAIIGPSGSGKTTFLRCLNRLADQSDRLEVRGRIRLFGTDIRSLDPNALRQSVGMVFQKPCIFPGSIQANLVFGLRHLGLCRRREERAIAERELARVGLLEEVQDRLDAPASTLSVGQQQRLCLARTLSLEPKVLLLDEPTSALDPLSSQKIEALVAGLKERCVVVLVTHSLNQARRLADQVVFLSGGRVVERGAVERIFSAAEQEETREFLKAQAEQ